MAFRKRNASVPDEGQVQLHQQARARVCERERQTDKQTNRQRNYFPSAKKNNQLHMQHALMQFISKKFTVLMTWMVWTDTRS